MSSVLAVWEGDCELAGELKREKIKTRKKYGKDRNGGNFKPYSRAEGKRVQKMTPYNRKKVK